MLLNAIRLFWNDYSPTITTVAGTSLMAVAAIGLGFDWVPKDGWASSGLGFTLWTGMALNAVGEVWKQKRAPRLTELQKQVSDLETFAREARLNYENILHRDIAILADELKFTANERISVYKHDGKAFVMLGRYSANAEYQKKGRKIYPENEGCIGQAYATGSFFKEFPDPDQEWENYLKEHISLGLKKKVIQKLTMKSRSYFVKALDDGRFGARLAVVVFESTQEGILQPNELERRMNENEGYRICEALKMLANTEPTPTLASKEGF